MSLERVFLLKQEDGELEGGGGHSEQQQPAPREVREREVRAVQAAEEGRLDEALQLLNEAVAMAPDSASVYNNRAQVRSCYCTHHNKFFGGFERCELPTIHAVIWF